MIRHSKRGQDHIYSVKELGRDVRITVSGNGYHLKGSVDIRFEALTDRQAVGFRTTLHNTIDEALRTAATQRHVNVPLFELPDEIITTQGVNEL